MLSGTDYFNFLHLRFVTIRFKLPDMEVQNDRPYGSIEPDGFPLAPPGPAKN